MLLRKALAGSDSYGNVWDTDGAVTEVDDAQAVDLLMIADAGFEVVEPEPEADLVPEPAEPDTVDDDEPDTAGDEKPKTRRPRK